MTEHVAGESNAVRLRIASFRSRLRARAKLLGTFVKTPHPVVCEVLGMSALDVLCIDAEHAPFDRAAMDGALLAARAADLPNLVRVTRNDPVEILQALDLGATGIVVPHVVSGAAAEAAARASRYGRGGRGYAGSTRAAGYATRELAKVVNEANAEVVVIAQIEDAEALEQLEDIAAVDSLDCLFIGRADLAVSLGAKTLNDSVVLDAVAQICEVGRRHGRAVGMFTPNIEEISRWIGLQASLFLLGSDQQWIMSGAQAVASRFSELATDSSGATDTGSYVDPSIPQ